MLMCKLSSVLSYTHMQKCKQAKPVAAILMAVKLDTVPVHHADTAVHGSSHFNWDINFLYSTLFSIILHTFRH